MYNVDVEIAFHFSFARTDQSRRNVCLLFSAGASGSGWPETLYNEALLLQIRPFGAQSLELDYSWIIASARLCWAPTGSG